jgi:DHA3 family tetracycline resistance protein-like MFS transporter
LKKHNARTVYLVTSFFVGLIFSMVFSATQIYRIQTVGLNPFQLVIVGTTLEITSFICEIPTGIVADIYSRRLSVIIGTFLFGIGFLVEGSFPIFAVILLAQIIWGTGWTFISGAHSAWITDEIGVENVGSIFIRSSQFNIFGNLVGIPIFILTGNISYRTPILIGGILFIFIGFYRLIFMPEDGFSRTPVTKLNTWKEMTSTFKQGVNLARSKPILLTFTVIAIIVGLYSEGYDRLSEAHFINQFSFPDLPWGGDPIVSWFALMRVASMLLSLGSVEFVRRKSNLKENTQIAKWLQVIYSLISLGLLVFAWSRNFYLAILATLLVNSMRSLSEPLIDTWVNKHIESRVRATMLSMTNQLDAFGQMIGGPLVGLIGNLRSIRAALTTSGILIIPAVPLYWWTTRQSDNKIVEGE